MIDFVTLRTRKDRSEGAPFPHFPKQSGIHVDKEVMSGSEVAGKAVGCKKAVMRSKKRNRSLVVGLACDVL